MTKKEILDLYGIEMQNVVVAFKPNENARIGKTFLGGDEMESYFDLALTNPDIINQDIIPLLQHFIEGNNPPMDPSLTELGGIGGYALIYLDGVRFYNYNNGEIIQTVPLEHFKVIAQAWGDFLLQNPV